MTREAINLIAAPAAHLFDGRITFDQPADGYRAPVDGHLLAVFAGISTKMAIDLGAGAGIITLGLLSNQSARHVVAVERDRTMADFLSRNLASNGFESNATVVVGDVEAAASARRGCADLVVANPPYWTSANAVAAQHPRARSARMGGEDGALPSFVRAARLMLGRGGRACFVWPASDFETLIAVAAGRGLHIKRARFVHSAAGRGAKRVLAEFKPGKPGGLVVESDLQLFDDNGDAPRDGLPTAE